MKKLTEQHYSILKTLFNKNSKKVMILKQS